MSSNQSNKGSSSSNPNPNNPSSPIPHSPRRGDENMKNPSSPICHSPRHGEENPNNPDSPIPHSPRRGDENPNIPSSPITHSPRRADENQNNPSSPIPHSPRRGDENIKNPSSPICHSPRHGDENPNNPDSPIPHSPRQEDENPNNPLSPITDSPRRGNENQNNPSSPIPHSPRRGDKNLNNPSSPIRHSPRRGDEILNIHTPQRPLAMSHLSRPVTPPPPPSSPVPHLPLLEGPSETSAFAVYTPNQEMTIVSFEGAGGDSEAGALVAYSGSPTKGGHPEEAKASGSGAGQGSSSSNPNPNNPSSSIRPSPRYRDEILNTRTPERPQPMSHLLRPVTPPPPPSSPHAVPHLPILQGPAGDVTHSSAFATYTPNREMALVLEGTGGGSGSGALVVCSGSPTNGGRPEEAVASGSGQGFSSSNPTPNNPSSLFRSSPKRGPEILNTRTPQRPRPMSHFFRPVTPPPPQSSPLPVPHRPLLRGTSGYGIHSSAFAPYTTPNQETALVPYEGTGGGGSRSGALVVQSGSPAKRGRPEKEAGASGTGQGSGDDSRKKCSICGKVFASEKAVFGHMRLHKNRGWKGAHPPPVFNAEVEFADVPGVNLPLVIREEGRVTAQAAAASAERAAAGEAEEAERALAVERRRGISIDLNVNLWTKGPDHFHDHFDNPDA